MSFDMSMLMDFYGQLLTPKTRLLLAYHFEEDMSFSEIAVNEGISRQAVHDSVKRGVKTLQDYEESLGLAERFLTQKKTVENAVLALEKNNIDAAKDLLKSLLQEL